MQCQVATIEPWRKLKVRDKTKHGIVDTVEGLSGFSTPFGWMKSVWKLPYMPLPLHPSIG